MLHSPSKVFTGYRVNWTLLILPSSNTQTIFNIHIFKRMKKAPNRVVARYSKALTSYGSHSAKALRWHSYASAAKRYVELVKDHTSYELGLIGNRFIFHKTFNYFLELKELAQKGNIFNPKQDLNVDDKKSILNRIREMKESLFNNKQLNMSPKLT